MKNYKATIQYEGSRYQGWQKQTKTVNTIQGRLETLLSKLTGETVRVHGSGRTDAGVHAYGQVISFSCNTSFLTSELMEEINRYLPDDIAVIELKEASPRFHARLNASEKTYRYRVLNTAVPHIFDRRYVFVYPHHMQEEAIRKGMEYLCGTHDFQAFTSKKNGKKSTVRTVYEIRLERIGDEWQFTFRGDGFLYHMVRIMTGTLLEIGSGSRTAESIPDVLESRDRSRAGFLAPAQGLALMKVDYH